ncbi:hypothetical protein DFH29DRAFT_359281 [Suillus ampliporus]|nr:hypothetical protein DFH29DRAFT_359281 [Suillus ampliporus]
MATLPQFPRSSSSSLWEQSDPDVDVSFYDGLFTDEHQIHRGFYYSPPMNMAHCHGGSQEDFSGSPLIDVRAWETLSDQSSGGFPCNSPLASDHEQYSFLMHACREYPASDIPTMGDLAHESTQSEWTTTPVDAHWPLPCTSFVLTSPPASVSLQTHVPLSVDSRDLHDEDKASDEIYRCPLPSSDGTRCDALIPCNEASITTHLRSGHALRAKRLEVINCLWPGCSSQMQAASIPRHIITLHVKTRFQCSYCGKSLTRKDGKMKHEKICPGKP